MEKQTLNINSFIGRQMYTISNRYSDNFNEDGVAFVVSIPDTESFLCTIKGDDITWEEGNFCITTAKKITSEEYLSLDNPEFVGQTGTRTGKYWMYWKSGVFFYKTLHNL